MGKVFTKTKSYFGNNGKDTEEPTKRAVSKNGISNIQIINPKLQRGAIVQPTAEVVDLSLIHI